jgi:hypothetical protein
MGRTAMRRPRKRRRNWPAFASFALLLSASLLLLGLETWELWMMLIVLYYVFWILRRE